MATVEKLQDAAEAVVGTVPSGAAPKGVFPPFDTTHFSSSLIWLALTFGLIYFLMSRVALPRMAGILSDRRARIDGDLNAAREAKARADDAFAAHTKMLADARANAQLMAQKNRDALNAQTKARQDVLEQSLSTRLVEAEGKIAATKAAAMTNVHQIAHDTASAIFARITGQAADADALHAALNAQQKA